MFRYGDGLMGYQNERYNRKKYELACMQPYQLILDVM